MLNIGGGEVLIILLVALIVLGPTKLPDAAKQAGKAMSEFRRLSSGFQRELKEAMDDVSIETDGRKRGEAYAAADPPPDAAAPNNEGEPPIPPEPVVPAEAVGETDSAPTGDDVAQNDASPAGYDVAHSTPASDVTADGPMNLADESPGDDAGPVDETSST